MWQTFLAVKLYKFRSFSPLEHLLDILVHRRLHCAKPGELNDPFEGVYLSALYADPAHLFGKSVFELSVLGPGQDAKRIVSAKSLSGLEGATDLRVCSLSATLSDLRLWSLYADGLRGVAVEIDVPTASAHRVNYVPKLPEHGMGILSSRVDPMKVLKTKTSHWRHEKEFRIIQTDEHFALGDAHIRVFVGTRISRQNFDLLRALNLDNVTIIPTLLDVDSLSVKSANFRDQVGD